MVRGMSEYMMDSGHHHMRTCDSCDGAFHCSPPKREADAAPDWTCKTCTEKDAVIKDLAVALDVVRPPERPAGCWCHHARDVKQAGHSAACVAACDAVSKSTLRMLA